MGEDSENKDDQVQGTRVADRTALKSSISPRPLAVEIVSKIQTASNPKTIAERLSTWVPLFISILALSVSIWSAYQTRAHDRLSVKPEPYFLSEQNPTKEIMGISLSNSGLGPALVKEIRAYVDGIRVTDFDEITKLDGQIFRGRTPQWYTPPDIVRSGEKSYLYYTPSGNVIDYEAFSDLILKRVFFIAEVCSLYDECATICTMLKDTQCEIEEKRRLKLGSGGSSAR